MDLYEQIERSPNWKALFRLLEGIGESDWVYAGRTLLRNGQVQTTGSFHACRSYIAKTHRYD
jgi:hypothetical protein